MTAGYLPGERWLIVSDAAVAHIDGSASDALMLWRLMSAAPSARTLLEALLRPAMSGDDGSLTRLGGFLLAVSEVDGLRVLCRAVDDAAVECASGETVAIPAGSALGWSESMIPDAAVLTVGSAALDELLPVPAGVVRASVLRWSVHDPDVPVVDPVAHQRFPPIEPPSQVLPLPSLPPFVPAPTVLPPIGPEIAERAIEETRIDQDATEDLSGSGQPADTPSPPGGFPAAPGQRTDTPSPPGDFPSAPGQPADTPSHQPPRTVPGVPIENVPGSARRSDPAAPAASAMPDVPASYRGDHDGLTQLAEDLPTGYTPPPLPPEPPLGSVLAVLCPAGHANAPHSMTCRLCGQLIIDPEPVAVQRPVLARIRLSTGDVVDLDRPVVVGRAPYATRVAASELPRLVTVPSPNQDISRAHAQIRAEDWQLVVADLDSTNGTTVRPPGRAPQRLHPGQEMVIEAGWSVELGDGISFVVEALA